MQAKQTVKFQYLDDCRRVTFPEPFSFKDFTDYVKKAFSFEDGNFRVKYQDEEQTWITVASDIEFEEAKNNANDRKRVLYFTISQEVRRFHGRQNLWGTCPRRWWGAQQQQQQQGEESQENQVHPFVVCDGCNGPVVGIRHKCTICPDFDLCSSCEAKGLHDKTHPLTKITTPFRRGCLGRGGPRGCWRRNHCSNSQQTEHQQGPLHERVRCDGCNGRVYGIRYKCSVCPDFDLCSTCEAKDLHNRTHPLIQLRTPVQPNFVLECFASSPEALSPASDVSVSDPNPIHKGFYCDGCGGDIVGARYRCTLCPDFDLCSKCQSLNKHTQDHPLLKIKVPLRVSIEIAPTHFEENLVLPTPSSPSSSSPDTNNNEDNQFIHIPLETKPEPVVCELPTPVFCELPTPVVEEPKPQEVKPEIKQEKFTEQLKVLENMGFVDTETLKPLLDQFDGEVSQVLEFLLN